MKIMRNIAIASLMAIASTTFADNVELEKNKKKHYKEIKELMISIQGIGKEAAKTKIESSNVYIDAKSERKEKILKRGLKISEMSDEEFAKHKKRIHKKKKKGELYKNNEE